MELAGNYARDRRSICILEEDIAVCIANDTEIRQIMSPVVQNLMIDYEDKIKKRTSTEEEEDGWPLKLLTFKDMSCRSLESFVSNGGNLKVQDSEGRTFLHYILQAEDYDIDFDTVSFLISQ